MFPIPEMSTVTFIQVYCKINPYRCVEYKNKLFTYGNKNILTSAIKALLPAIASDKIV